MAEITKTRKKNVVEIYKDLDTKIEYLKINGITVGVAGFTSEEDRARGMKAVQEVVDSIESTDPYVIASEVMNRMKTLAAITENNIDPDEQIKVEDTDIIVSYKAKAAYYMDGSEAANCTDLPDMPAEAIKAVLTERVKTKIAEEKAWREEAANWVEFMDADELFGDDE